MPPSIEIINYFHQISSLCCFNVLMYYSVLITGGTYRSLVTRYDKIAINFTTKCSRFYEILYLWIEVLGALLHSPQNLAQPFKSICFRKKLPLMLPFSVYNDDGKISVKVIRRGIRDKSLSF